MKGLILDTSGETALIALSDEGKSRHHFTSSSIESSSLLAAHIQTVLTTASLSLSQLHYIGIGIGPGSFLGTRIGVIIAKSLAYGLQIPLISFCSLEAYEPKEPMEFAVVTDAKSKGVYLLKGRKTHSSVVYDDTPTLCSIENLLSLYPQTLTLITPHKEVLLRKLTLCKNTLLEVFPSIEKLCAYCDQQYRASHFDSLENLPIHYLRLS
jgi:tRNA threonylcarbamoyladenosine biosynthesis protein TsaB